MTAGHSQVDGRKDEQGVKVSLVCYIGFVALTMITIIKGWYDMQIILILRPENIKYFSYEVHMDKYTFISELYCTSH